MLEAVQRGYIGHPNQQYMLRRVTVNEGRARGTEIIEVLTTGGLALDILPCSGLDIGKASYRGINMSWMSKNGYDAPANFIPYESEFVNTFPGGLLYTCGLRSAGPANRDNGEYHPLHGRYHGLSATEVAAYTEGENIIIRGVIRETALFSHCLEVKRKITIPIFGASTTVEDEITNQTPQDQEIMQVYHCNFGYPLLSEKARLILPEERETIPRTPFAATGLEKTCTFEPPVDGEEERVFFQKMKRDFTAKLENPELGISMTMTWGSDRLPILSQWRSMASGDYVLGLEPANCYIMGRSAERENGSLPVLKAWETEKHTVTITFEEDK